MAERPTETPEWASAPPANTITSPTLVQRQAGYQPTKPRRQHTNWLLNLGWQWFEWLRQSMFRPSSIAPDQSFGGAAPVTGAGLVVAANSFSAGGFVDGYAVPVTQAQGYTYSATSDTYWDLGRDAVWRPVVVASAAAEPAVTSSPPSVRVFRVRTDATDRIGVVDRRRTRVTLLGTLDVLAGARFGLGRLFTEPAIATTIQDSSAELYVLESEHVSDNGGSTLRWYLGKGTWGVIDGDTSRKRVMVDGARYTGGGSAEWVAEIANPRRWDFGSTGVRRFRPTGIAAAAVFADSAWVDVPGILPAFPMPDSLDLGSRLSAGTWLNYSNANYSGLYRELSYDPQSQIADVGSFNFLGLGLGRGFVVNARFVPATGWVRTAAGQASRAMVILRGGGVRFYETTHLSASWADSIGGASWTERVTISDHVISPMVEVAPIVSGTPVANALYADNTIKARASITTDGAGGITLVGGFNITSVAIVGGVAISVTFDRDFADTSYAVSPYSPGFRTVSDSARAVGSWSGQIRDEIGGVVLNVGTTAVRLDVTFLGAQ